MTWEPSEIKGWTIVGYGFDDVEQLSPELAGTLDRIVAAMAWLNKDGIDCDDDDFAGIIAGLDGIDSKGLGIDNWGWGYYNLFSQFDDSMYTSDTIVGAGPGLSWCALGIYVREGRGQAFAELFSEFADRFEQWAQKAIDSKSVLEKSDCVDPEEVRARLAKLWGVEPAKIRFRGEPSEFMEPDTICIRGMDLGPHLLDEVPEVGNDLE